MKCPYCGNHHTKVIETRHISEGLITRRRLSCYVCQGRFTTFENISSSLDDLVEARANELVADMLKDVRSPLKKLSDRLDAIQVEAS